LSPQVAVEVPEASGADDPTTPAKTLGTARPGTVTRTCLSA
jgi:hypothetical protein